MSREVGVFLDALRDGFHVCRVTLCVVSGDLKSNLRGRTTCLWIHLEEREIVDVV